MGENHFEQNVSKHYGNKYVLNFFMNAISISYFHLQVFRATLNLKATFHSGLRSKLNTLDFRDFFCVREKKEARRPQGSP
jgi:hypothetical protein